jgi:hypothetical protein
VRGAPESGVQQRSLPRKGIFVEVAAVASCHSGSSAAGYGGGLPRWPSPCRDEALACAHGRPGSGRCGLGPLPGEAPTLLLQCAGPSRQGQIALLGSPPTRKASFVLLTRDFPLSPESQEPIRGSLQPMPRHDSLEQLPATRAVRNIPEPALAGFGGPPARPKAWDGFPYRLVSAMRPTEISSRQIYLLRIIFESRTLVWCNRGCQTPTDMAASGTKR